MFHVCHAVLSVHCSLLVTCWERANLLALLYVMFYCVFVTFPCGVLGQVWYLIVSIPNLGLLPYFNKVCCKGTALYIVREHAVTSTCEMVIIPLMPASFLDDNDDDNDHNDEDCGSHT